jgi:hypothetical protein
MFERFLRNMERFLWLLLLALLLSTSGPVIVTVTDQVRTYTQDVEFDFLSWTLNSIWIKTRENAISSPYYLDREKRKQVVTEYIRVTGQAAEAENRLSQIYADPSVVNPEQASSGIRRELGELSRRRDQLQPLAEAVLEAQVAGIVAEQGLTTGGQPIPSILFENSSLPNALIVSPRSRVEQIANISVLPDMTAAEQDALERRVDSGMDVSSLVVPVGGLGSYPTMIMRTTDLRWLVEVIAHEWIHNYLTLRPLGFNYATTPELRTMNETTASLAGKELGQLVIERYYPELAYAPHPTPGLIALPDFHLDPKDFQRPVFDYRAEMHTTRVTADALLTEGKIDEAEAYMEQRRQLFWQHGYLIRKLNQAYFAFYGAYADVPGGAAGQDPVGPAVVALRERSSSLADFINTIAWMTSFEELQQAIKK